MTQKADALMRFTDRMAKKLINFGLLLQSDFDGCSNIYGQLYLCLGVISESIVKKDAAIDDLTKANILNARNIVHMTELHEEQMQVMRQHIKQADKKIKDLEVKLDWQDRNALSVNVDDIMRQNQNITQNYHDVCAEISQKNQWLQHYAQAIDHQNWWAWQHDGNDDLESIVCPVLIRPDHLREIIAERDKAFDDLKALRCESAEEVTVVDLDQMMRDLNDMGAKK